VNSGKGVSIRATLYGRFSFKASGFLLQSCECMEDFSQRKQSISKIGMVWKGRGLIWFVLRSLV
jgi:hypothetical protein